MVDRSASLFHLTTLAGRPYSLEVPESDRSIGELIGKSGRPYEADALRVMAWLCRGGGTFVDVGAHVGNHSIFLAMSIPALRVDAIEAHPETFMCLRRNVVRNALDGRVRCHNVAAGERTGSVKIIERDDLGMTQVAIDPDGPIPMVPVTDIIDRPVTLIKIDVEGFEVQAVRGLESVLREDRPAVVIEVQDGEVLRLMKSLGFTRVPVNLSWTPTFLFLPSRSQAVRALVRPMLWRSLLGRVRRRVRRFRSDKWRAAV